MNRTLVIRDIHGANKALLQVLERAEISPTDKLIFLGDYADGWSESAQVVDTLIELSEKMDVKPVFILGNHDEWVRDFLSTGNPDMNWIVNGGLSTLGSYQNIFGDTIKENDLKRHQDFYNNLVDHYVDEENRAFVHAGCDADKGVKQTLPHSRVWDRYMWREVVINRPVDAHTEVFIGHTPTLLNDTDQPIQRNNVWNLDTGAGWSGKLTIMDIDTKEYWQSDNVKTLYPNEKGKG